MPRQPILVVRAFISINGEKSPCRHSGDLTGQQPSDKFGNLCDGRGEGSRSLGQLLPWTLVAWSDIGAAPTARSSAKRPAEFASGKELKWQNFELMRAKQNK